MRPYRQAYFNKRFLETLAARPIRLLSEYLYPQYIFEQENVTDTIVVFGSARVPSPEKIAEGRSGGELGRYYQDARDLGFRLARWSEEVAVPRGRRFLVCTGGGPGIMEAANRGAHEAGGPTIGLNINIPAEQVPNPYISREFSFDFQYFFMRKYWFLYHARVLIVFPGGFGTMDELFETLTLQQTRNIARRIPVILFGRKFWERVIDLPYLVESGMIAAEDLKLMVSVDSVAEALDVILPILSSQIE